MTLTSSHGEREKNLRSPLRYSLSRRATPRIWQLQHAWRQKMYAMVHSRMSFTWILCTKFPMSMLANMLFGEVTKKIPFKYGRFPPKNWQQGVESPYLVPFNNYVRASCYLSYVIGAVEITINDWGFAHQNSLKNLAIQHTPHSFFPFLL